ncbi:flagellar hook-basal body complex protein FliE [Hathewaya histolytica]|uniref:Flagellar hook-basal body complex protein FliE n=1 Tax=Hathewaya histolytica TaxID=1498 RepID=A0A4U9R7Y5_HATHI|nr:flagellar hook-basal body complex protein FliE [Hathewaya histolytica]VTQ87664.1 flagellar hook-basal body complex protein (FliE) [Hathewaya histolytica]
MKINEFIPIKTIDMLQSNKEEKVSDNKSGFAKTLKEELDNVNEVQLKNQVNTSDFLSGKDIDMHELMLGASEAKISLQYAIEIRNKLLDAYTELNRMQL